MEKIVLFWIVFGVLGFAFALGVQMRVMIALVLRRALMAREAGLDEGKANAAIIEAAAADGDALGQRAAHLVEVYPQPLRHLRLARRVSIITPVMLLMLLLVGRFGIGVI